MKERRRTPRVSLKVPIADIQSFFITNGSIININEHGIRYLKPVNHKKVDAKMYAGNPIPITVRTIHFSLPGVEKPLRLVCHVIAEQVNNEQVESSCEFLGISNEERYKIREYVANFLS